MAHKKAAGSAKNLRDSNPQYRGVKLFGGQTARMGNIIIRQKGDKYQLGENVYKGKDYTIHAAIDGVVHFRKKKFLRYDGRKYLKTVVDVYPAGQQPTPMQSPTKQAKTAQTPKKKAESKKPAAPKKEKQEKLTSVTQDAETDDLTKIEGIGPKIQEILYAEGIATYEALSTSKVGDLRAVLKEAELSQHDPKTWKKQATLAKHGKWDELTALQDELIGGK